MEPLPRSFLEEIARKYDLSEEQATVFIEFFGSKNPSQQEIADSLFISPSAVSTRMTGVYQKFNFKQRKPNKSRLLHDFLLKEFHKSNSKNNKSRVGIAHLTESAENIQQSEIDINALVNKLRKQVQKDIETRCGTMRILDMSQPIGLGKIYTKVNILEKISGRKRKDIAELIKGCSLEDFERFTFGKVTEEKIPGEEAVTKYSQLFILGKPGAGKTTFLKHIVIQCIRGSFQRELVPFFVTLKDFAEAEDKPKLLDYLSQYIKEQNRKDLQQILQQGKALICLDGLDEVLEADSPRVIREIETLTSRIIYLNFDLGFNLNLYLYLYRTLKLNLNLYRTLKLNLNLYLYRNLNLNRDLNLNLNRNFNRKLNLYLYRNLYRNLNLELAKESDPQLYEVLLKLKERLPDEENSNETEFTEWWQENGQAWSVDFRNAMIKYQNIGHDWQFSESQKALLGQYYRANQLLTQCLHHECYVSREVRQEIEETLLLPIAEIEKRKKL
ncbi:MAG: NACHT domain-containing protein [Xenococcus sp. MO_188.B8]|nr:NACHT domain-containing protein [Xenococcus sp. MO_188.B8]